MFSLLKSCFRSSVQRTHTNDELHSKTPCPFSARPIVSRLTQINFCRFQTTDQFRLFVFVLFVIFFPCPMRNVSLYKRCPRRSVWSRPVNGKNWCTRIDALLTGLPAAAVEPRDERRVKPVCGSFELCNCSAGSAILPPPPPPSSATTVHGTFSFPIIAAAAVRGEKEECVSINRSAHYTYYVCIEGREKKKEKKRVQAVWTRNATDKCFFTFRLYYIGTIGTYYVK